MALDVHAPSPVGQASSMSSSTNTPPAILNVRPPTAESARYAAHTPSFTSGHEGNGSFGYDQTMSGDIHGPIEDNGSSFYSGNNPMLQPMERMQPTGSYDSLFLPRPQPPQMVPEDSRTATLISQNYAFNPGVHPEYMDEPVGGYEMPFGGPTRQSTMLDMQQGYFSDFAGQQHDDFRDSYGGGGFHRYSQSDAFSPTANMAPPLIPTSDLPHGTTVDHLLPLEPRDIPFAVNDPHDKNIPMSNFDNIPAVLRHRARAHAKQAAYWVLDQKGKEIASITWDKLASRAEKVAQVIRDKSNLYRGDRVALIYRDHEIIEFAVALMGCFIAGVVAVPINSLEDYQSLNLVLTSTQAHLDWKSVV